MCSGRVLAPLEIKPQRASFGKIRSDAPTLYEYLTILRGDGGPIAPEVLSYRQPGLDARICEIEPGSHYELVVSLTPPFPKKQFRNVIRLKTGLEEAPTTMVYVTGAPAPRVEAVPNRLTFSANRVEESEQAVRLAWDDGNPAKILGVETTVPRARVRFEEGGRFQKVVLTVPAGSEYITSRHTVTIRTADPTAPTLSVPVSFRAGPRRANQGSKGASLTRSTKVRAGTTTRSKPDVD